MTAIQKEEHLPLIYYFLLTHPPGCRIIMEECVQTISYCDSPTFFQGIDFLETVLNL